MPLIHEKHSEQFYSWELRGRGTQVFSEPVSPEPPFRPFNGHYLPDEPVIDDGRRPTFLSSFVERLSKKLAPAPQESPGPPTREEPEPETLIRDHLVELQTTLPADLDISKDAFEHFLHNLSLCREPIGFELLGTPKLVIAQFTAHPADASLLERQLQAHFPEALFQSRQGTLEAAWETAEGDDALVVEFGLEREFMFSLASGKLDPFIGIVAAMSALNQGELALFQVLWQSLRHPWAESIVNSVTGADGRPFFVNAPELAKAAEEKVSRPLFATVVRIALKSGERDRTVEIARDLAASLSVFARPGGNELIPLSNEEYPFEEHVEDTLKRQSRRSGMILNCDELIGFVHVPGSAVRSPFFLRQTGKTKAAPAIVRGEDGLLLGSNDHAGESVSVRLTSEQRVRHVHIIGASGTGKSSLLFNLIAEDIERGEGVAVLDPHGDLVDKILGVIPEGRIDDVVLVNPSDADYSVGFNILSAHSDLEKNLLASDLVSVFQRLSTSWGDQMNSVLQNAILALLESSRGGTIADLRRFLVEPAFRAEFLTTVADSEAVYFWQKSFPHLGGGKSIGSILTRLNAFLAQKPIRHMVSQAENRLDFARIMDQGHIFLAKLPEGLLGNENSHLLGSLLVSKFQQTAMSRQTQEIGLRRDFWLYIDEFANFITPTMAEILSGARKYRIGLTLAHHELHQLQKSPEAASAVMSHPYTRIVFRVGDDDARKLADGFAYFEAPDLRNLETGRAIARVERSDYDFNLTVPLPVEIDKAQAKARRDKIITASREKYARPRSEIEAALREMLTQQRLEASPSASPSVAPRVPKSPKPVPPPDDSIIEKQIEPKPAPPPPQAAQKESAVAPGQTDEQTAPIRAPSPTPDLGRGGAQHKAIQRRIKEAAERIGFRSTIEKEISSVRGSVDLFLERGPQAIACEISISTTVDHEVGNVEKCLRESIPAVAVICLDEDRLRRIRDAVLGSLGEKAAASVTYFLPDAFISHLEALPYANPPESAAPTVRRGYKVKRIISAITAEERRQQEEVAIRTIAETMRRSKEQP